MKHGSIAYWDEKFSTCEIAGAVALCVVRDLQVNLFRFGGFPQILVKEIDKNFEITIGIDDEKIVPQSFILQRSEAIKAAKKFQSNISEYDDAIFGRVQDALSKVVG